MKGQVCNTCNVEKNLSDFYKRSNYGVAKMCKLCTIKSNTDRKRARRPIVVIPNLRSEKWEWIHGYEGMFMVSNMGRVKGVKRWVETIDGFKRLVSPKLLTGTPDKDGYLMVGLTRNAISDTRRISRLVAAAFIPNPENKSEVNHKKGIISDNRASQLEWATSSENKIHSMQVLGRKHTKGESHHLSVKIKIYPPNEGKDIIMNGIAEASRRLHLCTSSIKRVLIGQTSEYLGYKFKYA